MIHYIRFGRFCQPSSADDGLSPFDHCIVKDENGLELHVSAFHEIKI